MPAPPQSRRNLATVAPAMPPPTTTTRPRSPVTGSPGGVVPDTGDGLARAGLADACQVSSSARAGSAVASAAAENPPSVASICRRFIFAFIAVSVAQRRVAK